MQTRPPLEVVSQTQPKGQSLAVVQALVQMNEGLTPKQSADWQSPAASHDFPRSEYWQVAGLPPPVFAVPPPEPEEQVFGPTLLPPRKPPLELPSQQVPKLAHAPGHAWAPSWQRLLTQRRELTGGPERQSQYQYGQSSGTVQEGAVDEVVPPPLELVPPPVPAVPAPLPDGPGPEKVLRHSPSEQLRPLPQVVHAAPPRPHWESPVPPRHWPEGEQQPEQVRASHGIAPPQEKRRVAMRPVTTRTKGRRRRGENRFMSAIGGRAPNPSREMLARAAAVSWRRGSRRGSAAGGVGLAVTCRASERRWRTRSLISSSLENLTRRGRFPGSRAIER